MNGERKGVVVRTNLEEYFHWEIGSVLSTIAMSIGHGVLGSKYLEMVFYLLHVYRYLSRGKLGIRILMVFSPI